MSSSFDSQSRDQETTGTASACHRPAGRCKGCGAELEPARAPGRERIWCSERCRKQTLYSTDCIDCGAPINGSDGPVHKRCGHCNGVHRGKKNAVLMRERRSEHRVMIEAMWADGLTIREIREMAGVPSFNPGPYRLMGYDLPYRYRCAGSRAA